MKTQNTKITKNIVLALLAISSINAATPINADANKTSYNITARIKQSKQTTLTSVIPSDIGVDLKTWAEACAAFKQTNHGWVSRASLIKEADRVVSILKDGQKITLDEFFFNSTVFKKDNGQLEVNTGNGDTPYSENSVAKYLSKNAEILFETSKIVHAIRNHGYMQEEQSIEKIEKEIFTGNLYIKNDNEEADKKNQLSNHKNREETLKLVCDLVNQAIKDGVIETEVKLNQSSYMHMPNFNKKTAIIVSSIVSILLFIAALVYYYYL